MNIPIKQILGQHTVRVAALDQLPFVVGPLPLPHREHHILERIRAAIVNALVVLGWIIGLVILLAFLSPTFEGHVEQFTYEVLAPLLPEGSDAGD